MIHSVQEQHQVFRTGAEAAVPPVLPVEAIHGVLMQKMGGNGQGSRVGHSRAHYYIANEEEFKVRTEHS